MQTNTLNKLFNEITLLFPSDDLANQEVIDESVISSNLEFFMDAVKTRFPESNFEPSEDFEDYDEFLDEVSDNVNVFYLSQDSLLADYLEDYANYLNISTDDLMHNMVQLPYVYGYYVFVVPQNQDVVEQSILGGDADDGNNATRFLNFVSTNQ